MEIRERLVADEFGRERVVVSFGDRAWVHTGSCLMCGCTMVSLSYVAGLRCSGCGYAFPADLPEGKSANSDGTAGMCGLA